MKEETAVLKECLYEAGTVIKKYFGKTGYRLKSKGNPVTKADFLSQKLILKKITKHFPKHSYLAEENAVKTTSSDYTWVIDPLDGTVNYAHSFPHCCATIALLKGHIPVLGGIYDPFRDELFFAQKGKGSFLNGKRICVSKTAKLNDSLLLTGFPYDRVKKTEYYCSFYMEFLKICHDIRRSGSAALDMAWLACGRIDGYWEFGLSPWDVSAGRLLVEEAGGKVTDFSAKKWKELSVFGKETLASNLKIHLQMVRIIKNCERKNGTFKALMHHKP